VTAALAMEEAEVEAAGVAAAMVVDKNMVDKDGKDSCSGGSGGQCNGRDGLGGNNCRETSSRNMDFGDYVQSFNLVGIPVDSIFKVSWDTRRFSL
jgi:hypothetical protein